MGNHHSRLAAVPEVPSSTETGSLTLAGIACNIANRRDELMVDSPVVEVAAAGYLAFAEATKGRTPLILAHRSADYAKHQRSAIKPICYEDMIGMAMAGNVDSKRALLALLAPILEGLDGDESGAGLEIGEAVADFARETGDVADAYMRGKTTTAIHREIVEAQESLKRLRNALKARSEISSALDKVLDTQDGGRQ